MNGCVKAAITSASLNSAFSAHTLWSCSYTRCQVSCVAVAGVSKSNLRVLSYLTPDFRFLRLWCLSSVCRRKLNVLTRVNWVQVSVVGTLSDRPKMWSYASHMSSNEFSCTFFSFSLFFYFCGNPAQPMVQDSLHLLQIIDPESDLNT